MRVDVLFHKPIAGLLKQMGDALSWVISYPLMSSHSWILIGPLGWRLTQTPPTLALRSFLLIYFFKLNSFPISFLTHGKL